MLRNWKKFTAVDDTPVDGATNRAVSSNWANDHNADLDAHTFNILQTLRTGKYFASLLRAQMGRGDISIVADRFYAIPFPVPRAMTVDRIAISIGAAGAGGAKCRLGIYNDGTNLDPGTLLLDAGEIDATGTGDKAITISQALSKGIYWLAFVGNDSTIDVKGMSYGLSILGAANLSFPEGSVYGAHSYAALPDPFPTVDGGSNEVFLIGLRIESLD